MIFVQEKYFITKKITPFAVCLNIFCSLFAQEDKDFIVTDGMRTESRYVVQALERTHYNKKPIAQLNSNEFINDYLNHLDANHLFFSQEEVNDIHNRFDPTMITFLKQGNIFPAFEIFKTFRKNFRTRVDWIMKRLDQPFDFSMNDTFIPTRKDLPFASSLENANDLWEKRLKYELLNEILTDPIDNKDLQYLSHHHFYPQFFLKEEIEDLDIGLNPKAISFLKQNNFYLPLNNFNIIQKNLQYPIEWTVLPNSENFEHNLQTAIQTVRKRYEVLKEHVDELDTSEIQEVFLTCLAEMYDAHSSYFSAESLEDFSIALSNSLVGIGAKLSMTDNYCTIEELIAGGPAERCKELKANDKILAVSQGGDKDFVDIIGMKLRKAVSLIRGDQGTTVRLLIRPADGALNDRKIVSLARDEIRLTSNLAEAKIYEIPKDNSSFKIGVIELSSFYAPSDNKSNEPSTTKDVKELIVKLKKMGMQGLVLDLRYNGGGLLPEAITLTGLFMPMGPVVHVRDSQGQIREFIDTSTDITWKGPLAILTSKFSASASEIFAGALKNYNRAIIIGDTSTYGKGTVQLLSEISKPISVSLWNKNNPKMGATKFTIQKWYLPDGSSTQLKGVPSDIVIPSINELLSMAEADLPHALSWDSIQTIPWTDESTEKYTSTINNDMLNHLRGSSLQRQQSLEEFQYLSDTIANFKKRQAQKEFSLNLAERKNEKTIDRNFRKTMEKKLANLSTLKIDGLDVKLDSVLQEPALTAQLNTLTESSELDSKNSLAKFDVYKRESLRIMSDFIDLQMKKDPKKLLEVIAE